MSWTENRLELDVVARMLVDADVLETARDVIDFYDKPHKWSQERAQWRSAGQPNSDSEGWELFVARLHRDL